jgi:pimeloyl-ACP methyl ester carboxylesterase
VWDARGSIVESEPLTGFEPASLAEVGEARRAVYRSVSAYNGAGSEVSGTFFLPKGIAPDGGWPVVSYAHGTTGLTEDCGPSLYPDLRGYGSAVAAIVKSGFAVAFTDFQGLGHPGQHPYLEPRTAAFNMIDAVRALRAIYGSISSTWMAVGGSQGGQAAWAANEYAEDYGAGMNLVGSVAISPPANISGFVDAAADGSLTSSQIAFMPLIVAGLEVTEPGLDQSEFLRGSAAVNKSVLMSCAPGAAKLFEQLSLDQVRPASPRASGELRRMLREHALPQRTLSAPMLVINGAKDDLVLPAWVSAAVARACKLGGTVQHVELSDRGHADVDPGDEGYQWMVDRFAGKPAPNNCA